jgi:hypothetical protein
VDFRLHRMLCFTVEPFFALFQFGSAKDDAAAQ